MITSARFPDKNLDLNKKINNISHSFTENFQFLVDAQIAQSVEQGTENPCVSGSIPLLGTLFFLVDPIEP